MIRSVRIGSILMLSLLLTDLISTVQAVPMTGKYKIDSAHSTLGFEVTNFLVTTVRGRFDELSGDVVIGNSLKDSQVRAEIKTASINTENEKRDTHLRSEDFFEVDKFPMMLFQSENISGSESDLKIEGSLTIKGIKKPVILNAQYDAKGNEFTVTSTLNRQDFGITHGSTIKNKVNLKFRIKLIKI